ncbi:MAG: TonB-dependent receptor, partial [Spongiibacteraceae bacterium]|nr:TonB-dependent receptor [Spongiibacteraceae bacterium]
STTIDWAFADNISLKSVTGWRGTRAGQDDPLDAISIPLLTRSNYAHPFADERDTDQYSQEFQLVGDAFENRLRWVGGLYGFRETTDSTTINKVGPFQFIDAIPGFPAEPNRYFYNTTASTLDVDNKAWSAFVQADWSMTEQWVLTLGARFTKETRELGLKVYEPDRSTLALNGVVTNNVQQAIWIFSQPNDFNPNHGFVLDRRSKESVNSSAWTPLVSLQYLIPQSGWVDNGTVYVTYSEGFRSGGLSESPLGDLDQFEPEKVKNYELGVKADLFDRRVRLNLSGFYMDYTNRQLTTVAFDTINFQPAGATINAKDSNISGIELESQFMVLPDLEVGFNATWSRGRIKEYTDTQISWLTLEEKIANWLPTPPPGCVQNFIVLPSNEISICEIDRSDENLPRLPKRSFMLSAQYFLQTDFGTIIPRVQGSWKFDIENCFDRRSCESGIWFSDKQFNLDARVTWLSQDSQWMFAVFGSNLTEEDYAIGGTPLVDALGFGGQSYAVPKMYGAELQYKY